MGNANGAHAHAYLIVDQRAADLVRFPDGTAELHPLGAGDAVAGAFNERPPSDGESAPKAGEPDEHEVRARLGEMHAAWVAATNAALSAMDRDETSLGNPIARRAAYLRRHPEPTPEDARNDLVGRRAAGGAPRAKARAERVEACWWARLAGADGFELPIEGPGAVPRAAIAMLLDRVSRDGWELRHVSEDRAAWHGSDSSSAVCVAVNLLLSRPLAADA